jgi:site-specific DNA-methyltransferase (adenine-specific)/modification methylase
MAVTEHGKGYARKIANDESPEIAVRTFKEVMTVLLPKTRPECDMYVFTSYQVLSDWLSMTDEFMPQFGFQRKAVLVWEKDGPGMGDLNCPWGMGVEFVLFFQKGPREKTSDRRNAVLHFPQLRPTDLIHPHEKPGGLLEYLIKSSTTPGQFLVDPFGGSGSLVRAARNCGRNAVAIEYDEKNYQLASEALNTSSAGFDFG